MRRFGRALGFTLMEVGLAITVGTVIVAAAVFVYQSAKESAGDSIARQRVADVQMLVENYFTQKNVFPNAAILADIYTSGRPDALKSPWGGPVASGLRIPSGPSGLVGIPTTDQLAPSDPLTQNDRVVGGNLDTAGLPGEATTTNRDVVCYVRLHHPGSPPLRGWRMWDAGLRGYVAVGGYAVAHNKHSRNFFFVTSGRAAQ